MILAGSTLAAVLTWPLLFWIPGSALIGWLRPDSDRASRAAQSLLLSPILVATWLWIGALVGVRLGVVWVAALPAISAAAIGVLLYRRRDIQWRDLMPTVGLAGVFAWSIIVIVVIPQRGLTAGMQWNDSFHTLLAQQLIDLGRIPYTIPDFMPGYRLGYPPSFHFLPAAWGLLSGAPLRQLVPLAAGLMGALAPVGAYAIARRLSDGVAAVWAGILAASFLAVGVTHEYTYGTGPMVSAMSILPLAVAGSLLSPPRRGLVLAFAGTMGAVLFYPFSALPTAIWCVALMLVSVVPPQRDRLLGAVVALSGAVGAVVIMPLMGLATSGNAAAEGGGGSTFVLLSRVVASIYFGKYSAEVLGWATPALLVLLVLGATAIVVAPREKRRDSLAVLMFILIGCTTYFFVYSSQLNAIGFSPNLIILYVFTPLFALAGAAVGWLWSSAQSVTPRRGVGFVIRIALVAAIMVGVGAAGYDKATRLRESAHRSSFVKADDVAAIEWVEAHSNADDRVFNDGMSDAGFWIPALAGRRTFTWYAGWPTLPPWGQLSSVLESSPPDVWAVATVQVVGSDITLSGLGKRKGFEPKYTLAGTGSWSEGPIETDEFKLPSANNDYILTIVYPPGRYPDDSVTIALTTPGGGKRSFKISDHQMRRTYFTGKENAFKTEMPVRLASFDWARLKADGYRYVFLGSAQGDPGHALLDRDAIASDPQLREVFASGGARVFEIVPAAEN